MSIPKTTMTISLLVTLSLIFLAGCSSDDVSEPTDNATGGGGDSDDIILTPLFFDTAISSAVTVSIARAENESDHEEPTDYTYVETDATTLSLNGTSVTIDGSGATADQGLINISAPGTYILSGTLSEGQVVVDSPADGTVQIVLAGVDITSSSDSGIRVDEADKAVLILADDTANSITDGTTYPAESEQNAAIWSDDDLSIGGTGSLTVTARFQDGVTSKDGLVIQDGTLTIDAPDEGIRGKDYLVIRGGVLDVTAAGDGLKSDEDEDALLGYILIQDGQITIDSERDAITAETDVLITGGTITARAGGGSYVPPDDDISTKGLKAGTLVIVDDGTLTLDTSDDAIHCDDTVLINNGTLSIASGDDGVHAELGLTINGGDLTVTRCYEGLESVLGDLVINAGLIDITASDDGINLSGDGDDPNGIHTPGDPYDMTFNGGWISVTSGTDGIDSNGSIVMTGGCLAIDGPLPGTHPEEGAIDYNGEFEISGGVLVAAGEAGVMAQTPGSNSSQPTLAITFSSSRSAGTIVTLEGDDGALSFEAGKSFQSLVVSAPWMTTGSSVHIHTGGSVTGSETEGLFDGGSVSGASLWETVNLSSTVTSVR